MTIYAPQEDEPVFDLQERITISYVGHGEKFQASLQSDSGLTAEKSYDWLLRAIRSIGFDQLAARIENNESEDREGA